MLSGLTKYSYKNTASGKGDLSPRSIYNPVRSVASTSQGSSYKAIAGANSAGGTPTGAGGAMSIGLTNVNVNLLDGIISQDEISLRRIYRDMYYHDTIAGAAVDLFSNMPFSDFTLSGVKDASVLRVYQKNIENLAVKKESTVWLIF